MKEVCIRIRNTCVTGLRREIENWEKRGWKTAKNKPVENAELWRRLKEVSGKHRIEWVWTPRKAASAGYEREDAIAVAQTAVEEHMR